MMARLIIALLLTMWTVDTWASDPCPPTNLDKEWSVACFDTDGDTRRVKNDFIDRINVSSYGTATILVGDTPDLPHELIAVDRQGNVVVPNIRHTGDLDHLDAFRGLGRFSTFSTNADGNRTEKCGYFQAPQYRVVIEPEFDQCDAFTEQGAFACKDCVSYCSDADCHVRHFIGGRGFKFDTNGKLEQEFTVKTLETFCRRPDLVRLTKISSASTMIQCDGPRDNPFILD